VAKTPNLDRLARRGMVFERAYCQQALCNPSRSSLLNGMRPDTLRIWNLPRHFRDVTPDIVTLPQYFKQHGYFTQDVGKIFHNFRTRIEGDPVSWSVPAVMHFANHNNDKPIVDGPLPPNTATAPGVECIDVPDEAYYDGRVAAGAVKALRELRGRSEPFFLAVGFWKPHTPFNAPKRYWDMYRREDIPRASSVKLPENGPEIARHNSNEGLGKDPANAPEFRHGYYAGTSYLDAQVGKVVDELGRLGLADSTLVIFWSDHGFELGEHGLWGKTSNFELDAQVPLIIAMPGMQQAGRRTRSLVELLDLFPTLVDLCGLPAKPGLQGVSLRSILDDPRVALKSAAFTQHPRPAHIVDAGDAMGYSMRDDRYRYTEWRDWKTGNVLATELYDHATDPDETMNLAPKPDRAATVKALAARLAEQSPRAPLPPK
jgi:iduronate 2-sulfatase